MKHFFDDLIILSLLLLSISLAYFAIVTSFGLPLVNILLLIIAIFVLLQGCNRIDKNWGIGKYQKTKNHAEEINTQKEQKS